MTPTIETPLSASVVRRLPTTLAYYVTFIGLGLVSVALGPTIPALAGQTGATLSQISILFTARSLGFMAGSFLVGRAYDRTAGHPILIGMLILMALMLVLVPLTPWLWLLVGIIGLVGLGLGSVDVGGNTLLVWIHRKEVGPYMNGLHFIWGVGAFLSPLLITYMTGFGEGLRGPFWSLALLILPVTLWLAALPSPRAEQVDQSESNRDGPPGVLWLITLFFLLYIAAEVSFTGWIFTYATQLQLADETQAAYLNSAFFGALTLTRLAAMPLAARWHPRHILYLDLLVCLLSAGIVLLAPTSLNALWAGSIGLGIGMSSIFPAMLDLAQRYMPISGRVTGWFFLGGSTGGMSAPWIIGQLFEPVGPIVVFWMIFGATLLAIGILLLLVRMGNRVTQAPGHI